MQARQYILDTTRQQSFGAPFAGWRQLIIPLLLTIGWGVLVLVGMYARPLALTQDVGAGPVSISGLYPDEHNSALSYAYTDGDAIVRIPQAGAGRFIIRVRMGGPGASVPVTTRLGIDGRQVDLGPVQRIRNYQFLTEADAQGSVQFQLLSQQTSLGRDKRPLGVLLDRVAVRSAGPAAPGVPLLLSALMVLGLCGAGVGLLNLSGRWKLALLLFLATGLGLGYGMGRGWIDVQVWWWILLASVFAAAALQLGRFDGRSATQPLYSVALLFIAWRAALWFLAALGVQLGGALPPLTERMVYDHTTFVPAERLWGALVAGWVHWDSQHYLSIATTGYEFYGQRWPNAAFFPLYPLLIRAVAPLLGGSATIAALLVAQLALFGALLLLYDLLARDFGRAVAYRSLLLLLLMPTSFFFAAAYSESLALLLLVAALWAIRRERWWLAGASGFLLALTRLPGVLIAPLIALAYLRQIGWRWRAIRLPALAALLPPIGLGLFLLFQWQRFGTPFAFLLAQRDWKNQLSPPWVIPQKLVTEIAQAENWPLAIFQAIFWLGFIVLTIAALRRLPPLYSLTLLVILLPPYLSSWPWSIARHVLLGFPAFIVLAQWTERPRARQLLIASMVALLVAGVVLFVNGYLVA
jgi:Mannosyltransferase (PIG-V)